MKSDAVTKGMQQAPHRSLFNALGLTPEELDKPLVGIVSSYNEIVPGHMNLDKIVEAVKLGVAMGGGTPIVFPAIAVCDGIAMGHVGPVDHPDGSGNEVPFLQHAVVQFHLHMGGGVLQADHQSLPPLVPPESGQALQAVDRKSVV